MRKCDGGHSTKDRGLSVDKVGVRPVCIILSGEGVFLQNGGSHLPGDMTEHKSHDRTQES